MINEEVIAAIRSLLGVIPSDCNDYADAPMFRQVQDRIKPIQNWLDQLTTDNSLTWEKLTDDGSIHDKDNRYNWADATAVKVAALNSAVYAGHSDWRLPTRGELLSAVADDEFLTSYYWSSSTYADNPTLAWFVNFYDGSTYAYYKSNYLCVRAVRGG